MAIKRVPLKGIKIAEAVVEAINNHCETAGLDVSLELESILAKHFDVLLIDDPDVLRILEEKDLQIISLNFQIDHLKAETNHEIAKLKEMLAQYQDVPTDAYMLAVAIDKAAQREATVADNFPQGAKVLGGPTDAVGVLVQHPEPAVAITDEAAITDEGDEGDDDELFDDDDELFEDDDNIADNGFPLDDEEDIVDDEEEIPSIPAPAATILPKGKGKVQIATPAYLAANTGRAKAK